jgi:predicted methyltransferase
MSTRFPRTVRSSASALAALALLTSLAACAPSSTGQQSARALTGSRSDLGVTERMPPSEGDSTEGPEPVVVSAQARAVVSAPDRSAADRMKDEERRPAELLTFAGVAPGMRVAVLVAGAGYTTELVSRAVAPGGTVFAENPSVALVAGEGAWASRLARPAMSRVVRVDRELDDPLPADATGLDLVVINLVYHDTVWMGVDRARMNRAVFDALRVGGRYVVIDRSARAGSGLADVRSLHRIEQSVVTEEVRRAGFQLAEEGNFLRNASDRRDSSVPPGTPTDTSDRFALVFVKPQL